MARGEPGARGGGKAVPDRIRKLLDHIVDHYVVRDEIRSIELDAPPREPGETIEADKQHAVRRADDLADDLATAFRRGLVLAYEQRQRGGYGGELALDDRQPEENRIADALIRFLVSHDLAASRTEETEPLHYRYHVAVDWARLAEVARDAEVDLDGALRELAPP